MSTKKATGTLNRLHRTAKAGERGFNTVAAIVANRGLKVLLHTFAQERRHMADELAAEIKRLGGVMDDRRSTLGIIHRGRMAVVGTMTIKPVKAEMGALREAAVGEDAAVRRYRQALSQELPAETRQLLEAHLRQIKETQTLVNDMVGHNGERLVVRLNEMAQDVQTAVRELESEGVRVDRMETKSLDQMAIDYRGKDTVVGEVATSGGVGGAMWGSVIGAIAGAGMLLGVSVSGAEVASLQALWAWTALTGTISGAIIGVVLGLFIGVSMREEDAYFYNAELTDGQTLSLLYTNIEQANHASQILHRIQVTGTAA